MVVDDFAHLIDSDDPLDPELECWLFASPKLGKVLQHPLVYGVPYFPRSNALYNMQLKQKEANLKEALQNKKWGSYIFLHERPHRLSAFMDIKDSVGDEYWGLVRHIWIDSENIWQHLSQWKKILAHPNSASMMEDEEKAFLDAAPDPLTIYRGCIRKNRQGLSWTLNADIAHKLGHRWNRGKGVVVKGHCFKKDVIAYLAGRDEQEIIILPKNVVQGESVVAVFPRS